MADPFSTRTADQLAAYRRTLATPQGQLDARLLAEQRARKAQPRIPTIFWRPEIPCDPKIRYVFAMPDRDWRVIQLMDPSAVDSWPFNVLESDDPVIQRGWREWLPNGKWRDG